MAVIRTSRSDVGSWASNPAALGFVAKQTDRLRVACPCMGIDGCGHALQVMSVPAIMVNCFDLESDYLGHLTSHLREMGQEMMMEHRIKLS